MSKAVQRRRGTTAEHTTFTGALGELTVDTTKDTLVVHDGAAAGGFPLLREDGSNSALALGSAGTPSLKFTGDPNTGLYSPGADQVAVATNGVQRLTTDTAAVTSTLPVVHPLGAVGTPSITFTGDLNTGFWSPAADTLAASTAGSERARIDSSGRLLVGTSTTSQNTIAILQGNSTNPTGNGALYLARGSATPADGNGLGQLSFSDSGHVSAVNIVAARDGGTWTSGVSQPARLMLSTTADGAASSTERLRIDSAGNVGLGGIAPLVPLDIRSAQGTLNLSAGSDPLVNLNILNPDSTIGTGPTVAFSSYYSGSSAGPLATIAVLREVGTGTGSNALSNSIVISQAQVASPTLTERMRIDSSGRLLVGTSTSRSALSVTAALQVEGTSFSGGSMQLATNTNDAQSPYFTFVKSRGTTLGSNVVVQNADNLGQIRFCGADGGAVISGAQIKAEVDGTPGANDMPGRLVFSTTADGAASPTERLRITSAGVVQIADAGNITVGTTTGTKIGTATTQKLGFYNKTPVVQPAAVADATDAASVITQLNALLAQMRDLGLIAT